MNRPYLNQIKGLVGGSVSIYKPKPITSRTTEQEKAIATPFAIKASSNGRVIYCTAAGSDDFFAIDSDEQ